VTEFPLKFWPSAVKSFLQLNFTQYMIGKRAKILSLAHVEDLLFFAQHTRHPIRNQVIVLLSLKAGLRAAEIANLSWDMVVDPMGEIATTLELRDSVAKKGSGRVIPIHSGLPPEKWSSLKYGLWPDGGLRNAEEETQGGRDCREAATG
jgi:integrase